MYCQKGQEHQTPPLAGDCVLHGPQAFSKTMNEDDILESLNSLHERVDVLRLQVDWMEWVLSGMSVLSVMLAVDWCISSS